MKEPARSFWAGKKSKKKSKKRLWHDRAWPEKNMLNTSFASIIRTFIFTESYHVPVDPVFIKLFLLFPVTVGHIGEIKTE
jgi:hypothetical protein